MLSILWFRGDQYRQICANKRVTAKYVQVNGLWRFFAEFKAKPRLLGRGFLFTDLRIAVCPKLTGHVCESFISFGVRELRGFGGVGGLDTRFYLGFWRNLFLGVD